MRRLQVVMAVLVGCFVLMCAEVQAQQGKVRLFEIEGGGVFFQERDMRKSFPAGLNLAAGLDFGVGQDQRLHLRPQVGVRFFSRTIGNNTSEQFPIVRLGGTVSYDTYYLGQTTFFPYLSLNYNWVRQYEAETTGYDADGTPNIVYSGSSVKGSGFSPELGVKVQYKRTYLKIGFDVFHPVLREQEILTDPETQTNVITHRYRAYDLNTFNVSVGLILF